MSKYAQRRDRNEPELVQFAKRLGWRLWQIQTPRTTDDLALDWAGLRRGVWHIIEIKHPDCEGHADEFTAQEKIFMADVFACGGKILVWRTKECVMRDSNARQSA